MADDAVTVEQLRRWYVDTLRASVLATDPVRVTAWTGLAAEIRAALGDAGVVTPAQAPAATEAVSPWRSVATDPPPSYVGVLASTDSLPVVASRDDANAWWDCPDGRPLVAPAWWMAIPAVPVSP